jgi:hypothetical protein
LFVTKNRRLPIVNLVILVTMLGGLLLGACGQADIGLDIDLDGGGEGSSGTNLANPTVFVIVLIAIIAVVALAAGRS